MFHNLIKEIPEVKPLWEILLGKGKIHSKVGYILLTRDPKTNERALVVRNKDWGLLYIIKSKSMHLTRTCESSYPTEYLFDFSDDKGISLQRLEEAFRKVEGFESAVLDLRRSISNIVKSYYRKEGYYGTFKLWLSKKRNRALFFILSVYILLLAVVSVFR